MRQHEAAGRFAERELAGFDDQGTEERIVVWIERKPGAVWAVGRAVNPHLRPASEPRADDYVFEGFELEDDVQVLERDGLEAKTKPFTRTEILKSLERWFFGRA